MSKPKVDKVIVNDSSAAAVQTVLARNPKVVSVTVSDKKPRGRTILLVEFAQEPRP